MRLATAFNRQQLEECMEYMNKYVLYLVDLCLESCGILCPFDDDRDS